MAPATVTRQSSAAVAGVFRAPPAVPRRGPCHALPCHASPRPAPPRRAVPRPAPPRRAEPRHAARCHAPPRRAPPRLAVLAGAGSWRHRADRPVRRRLQQPELMPFVLKQCLAGGGMRFQDVRAKPLLMIAQRFSGKRLGDRLPDVALASHPLATERLFFDEGLFRRQEPISDAVDFPSPHAGAFAVQVARSSHDLVITVRPGRQTAGRGNLSMGNDVPTVVGGQDRHDRGDLLISSFMLLKQRRVSFVENPPLGASPRLAPPGQAGPRRALPRPAKPGLALPSLASPL